MAKGVSVHIGLNTVDATRYKGKYRQLRNAENDAEFYYDLAKRKKYDAVLFAGKNATSANLLDQLSDYSTHLDAGDICFISYSGHGSRVTDLNRDEDDRWDEVLVLYDRLFIDDEFQSCWAKFKPGIRVFFINDSCYNGTVTRFFELNRSATDVIYPEHVLRGLDRSDVAIDFENNISYYKSIKLANATQEAACFIIHIGACQDNQLADDGAHMEKNGKFTGAVKQILDGEFVGSYKAFFSLVRSRMPPWQTPNWDTLAGTGSESFEKSGFLSI